MNSWLNELYLSVGISFASTLAFCGSASSSDIPDEIAGLRSTSFDLNLRIDRQPGLFEQAVGFYSNGSLINASQLLSEGPGFLKIIRFRDRAWSSGDLAVVIRSSAEDLLYTFPGSERVQIGDMSAKAGGAIGQHASHQNGLDADIAYLRMDQREQDPDFNGFDEYFVQDGRLTSNFDLERNWFFLQSLVGTGRVGRIFVDIEIKKTFCDRFGNSPGTPNAETLRRLRPWPNHANHLHLRITCPKLSPRCVAQDEPAPGDGCAELKELEGNRFYLDRAFRETD
jgi:penicillin-insensitive murein DD-endopeptidase